MLDILRVGSADNFNIATLKTVTRLEIFNFRRKRRGHITLPPSVRYLKATNISQRELVSLLYQCPNLVKCFAYASHYVLDKSNDNAQSNKPFIFNSLKRLTLRIDALDDIAPLLSAQNVRLPSLELLQLVKPPEGSFIGIHSFCCNLSATLTNLNIVEPSVEFDSDNLYRLCKLPFPNLRKLQFEFVRFERSREAIHTLARLDSECYNQENCHLPALKSITLKYWGGNIEPRALPDLVKEWRIGEAFYFHLLFDRMENRQWTVALLDELRSNVGSRKIEITWGSCRLQESYVQDGSLRKSIQG